MFAQAKSTGDKEVLESEYYRKLKIAAEKAVKDQDKNAALVEFEKIKKDYNDKVKEYQAQFGKGLISQKELNENLASLALDTAKSAAGIKGIGDEANLFIAAMQMNAEMLKSPIKIEPRDATFDYKKNEVDIASENLDKAKEYADKLKEQARSIGQTLSDEIANAIANVPTLEEALKLAQVKQDIKDFTKELNEGVYSGIKEIAGSSDRVVNAFSQLRDIMDDVDASGWEKVMAVWNAMANVVDSFLSIARMIENMTELTNKLVKAKETEAAIESAATAAKVTNITTQTATEVAASTAKAEAATIEMAAKSTAAYAAIPFVGVGFAEAQIAAMQSLIAMAAVPKFANGGIVTGGPTSGDKILARVNAGEMILNQSQQSRLWQAIQSGRTMAGTPSVSQSMTTKVRGKDLLLTINNELKSQGKKPL